MEKIKVIEEKGRDLVVESYDYIEGVDIFVGNWYESATISLSPKELEEFVKVLQTRLDKL